MEVEDLGVMAAAVLEAVDLGRKLIEQRRDLVVAQVVPPSLSDLGGRVGCVSKLDGGPEAVVESSSKTEPASATQAS